MIQPQLITLPYQPKAALDIFAPFANQPWSMLLHSGNSDHPDSRFDILVSAPTVTLVTRGGITEIRSGEQCKFSGDDPFLLLQQQLSHTGMVVANPSNQLPFQGGALGIFSYDLVRRIETLPSIAQHDLNFPDMAVGIYDWAIIIDHKMCKVTLVTHSDPTPILAHLSNAVQPIGMMPFRLLCRWHANMNRSEYGEKFRCVQQYLRIGDCYQVCLAQRFSASYIGNEWLAFCHLLAHNHAPFSAFIRLVDQVVLSLSPERFLRLRGTEIQTKPIKGTIPRVADVNADHQQAEILSLSIKDRIENLMIVDLLRSDIGRVAQPGSIHVPVLFAIEAFPAVYHMVSTINATLTADYSAFDLLRACFPGGSVTGAPKIRAMEIIEQLEPQRRSAWCGSIGYLSFCGNMDTNIAIRTLLAERQHIFCSVGSGIVIDSDEDTEYQETLVKASTLLPLLEDINT